MPKPRILIAAGIEISVPLQKLLDQDGYDSRIVAYVDEIDDLMRIIIPIDLMIIDPALPSHIEYKGPHRYPGMNYLRAMVAKNKLPIIVLTSLLESDFDFAGSNVQLLSIGLGLLDYQGDILPAVRKALEPTHHLVTDQPPVK